MYFNRVPTVMHAPDFISGINVLRNHFQVNFEKELNAMRATTVVPLGTLNFFILCTSFSLSPHRDKAKGEGA